MLTPRISTHGERWVYATDEVAMSAVFLGRLGGDFTCASGAHDGKPYLVERFSGAMDRRYKGIKGSIYILPAKGFVSGKTSWSKDLVCCEEVKPIREIRIEDAKTYLLTLADEGKITLKFYPDRLPGMPEDDEDLVARAAKWSRRGSNSAINGIKEFHPHLLARVMQAIADGRYQRALD